MNSKWSTVPLSDVLKLEIDPVQVESDIYYKISGVYSFGRGLLTRSPLLGAETTYKVFHRLHENDFVISHLKAWEGAIARVTASFDGWFLSPQFSTFRPDPDRLEISYLEWYCKQSKVWDDLRNKSRGMGARRDSVSPLQFLALSIPLPPIDEQRRIVARIEEMAVRIEEARDLRRQAVEEAEILYLLALRSIFEKGFKMYPIDMLSNLCETMSGGTPSRNRPDFYSGNIPWIKSGELNDGFIGSSEECITESALRESNAKLIHSGTILVAMYGATVGKTGVLSINAATNQAICGIIPGIRIYRDYLWWFLKYMKHVYIKSSFGGAQPNISQKVIRETKVPVPPIREQQLIVSHLNEVQSKLDALRRHQAETAAALDALLPAVLERAFRGEL
jgi:type I restriction enzyme S subunit